MAQHSWPINFILDVLLDDMDASVVADMILPPEGIASIEHILYASLSPVEVQIIHRLYRDGCTVEETALRHHYSPEGIRLIQSACLDLFRRPIHRRQLRSALASHSVNRKSGSDKNKFSPGQQTPVLTSTEDPANMNVPLSSGDRIANTNLSTRTKNILGRRNIHTVQTLLALSPEERDQLLHTRSCGAVSQKEILDFIAKTQKEELTHAD